MTNEEAIDYMNVLQAKCENGYEAEAINLAIEALKDKEGRPQDKEVHNDKTEQPCKSCGGTIFKANCPFNCPLKKYEEVENND